jgi:starch-binding outer membrane protein, SusD/RagB family
MKLILTEKIYQRKRVTASLVCGTAFAFFACLTGCKKFVDVEVPKTLLYSANTFNSNGTATAALTAIYSQMGNGSILFNLPQYTGLSGDELFTNSTVPELLEIYKNNIQTKNSFNQNIWTTFYKYIYQANSIIEGLQNSSGVSATVKNQLIGEAKFIRAYCLFILTDLYGDVPVITSTDYKINNSSFRVSQSDVYSNIINDLKEAQGLLNVNYVDANDTSTTSERIRPNSFAASALLARAYLYKGDWTNAELQATAVINNSLYDTVPLNQVFLKNVNEAIWQIQPDVDATGFNTAEGQNFILTGPLNSTSANINSVTISDTLIHSFEAGDARRTTWIKDTVFNSTTYSFPYKYKVNSSSTSLEYSTILRLGEVYLIRAEARAQLGEANAVNDLNVIRKRAGLADYSGATDKISLLAAILHERQVELFTEQGHRWFDLKRTGKIDAVMTAYAPTKGATWSSSKQLFPIPQNERNNDPNLSQNNGY